MLPAGSQVGHKNHLLRTLFPIIKLFGLLEGFYAHRPNPVSERAPWVGVEGPLCLKPMLFLKL
jgi:hypothetical protein